MATRSTTRREGRKEASPRKRTPSAATRPPRPAVTVHKLERMSQRQLDDLYRKSSPGAIPEGAGDGTVVVAGGRPLSRVATPLARLGWQGKVFDPARKDLRNRILPFGLRAVRAQVSRGKSLLDGKPAIVLDYSRTSLLAHYIRDEIREVAPGLYLGIVYLAGRKTINFVLDFGDGA